jgi:hypothetical protein
MCDDDCPNCGFRHLSLVDSDDLSIVIEKEAPQKFVVSYSPRSAEDSPDYERTHFNDEDSANSFARTLIVRASKE